LDEKDVASGCAAPLERRFGSPLVLSRVHWVKPKAFAMFGSP
jgi:hypothetical protein